MSLPKNKNNKLIINKKYNYYTIYDIYFIPENK